MKPAIALLAVAIAFLILGTALAAADYVEYNINVREDGSAYWTIIHVTDIDTIVDSWEDFEYRLISAINNAKDKTGREMAPDVSSLEMSTQIHWETSSKTIMYVFRWENFSIVEEGQISIGDVFEETFFSLLYGEGELILTYPSGYVMVIATSCLLSQLKALSRRCLGMPRWRLDISSGEGGGDWSGKAVSSSPSTSSIPNRKGISSHSGLRQSKHKLPRMLKRILLRLA